MTLFPSILLLCGKVNFTNLSRYSDLSERTFRRQYSQAFDFMTFNAHLIAATPPALGARIAAMDHSFIPKSGKHTHGLDWFYNGSASRCEKGLEICTIAIVDVETRQAYTLSVQQTPAHGVQEQRVDCTQRTQRISQTTIEQVQAHLQQLPPAPIAPEISKTMIEQAQAHLQQLPPAKPNRLDHAIAQLRHSAPHFPKDLKYLAVDAAFSKQKFVDAAVALNLHLVGKLRHDANLKYLYEGEQKPRGAKRKYDGKVNCQQLSRFTFVQELEPHLKLYTALVWHVSLKRQIRIACLVDQRKPTKARYALFFSTDIHLEAQKILTYYRARFQIEFIFREAKQFTGLCDAQTRDPQRLDFHFNASLTALNLARYDVHSQHSQTQTPSQTVSFSMTSYKRLAFNDHLLSRFISMLNLDSTLIKSHPNYEILRSYGIIDP